MKDLSRLKPFTNSVNALPRGIILRRALLLSGDFAGPISSDVIPKRRFFLFVLLSHLVILVYLFGVKQGEESTFERAEDVFVHVYKETAFDPRWRDDTWTARMAYRSTLRDISYEEAIKIKP